MQGRYTMILLQYLEYVCGHANTLLRFIDLLPHVSEYTVSMRVDGDMVAGRHTTIVTKLHQSTSPLLHYTRRYHVLFHQVVAQLLVE